MCRAIEIGDKGQEVTNWRSNCTNGSVRIIGIVSGFDISDSTLESLYICIKLARSINFDKWTKLLYWLNKTLINTRRGRVDDLSFFDYLSLFC